MKRTVQLWAAFAACLVVMLAAMGWVSLTVLRLERENEDAQRQADLEETVRLALWRMDSAIAPLIIEESARPYFEYAAFSPAEVVRPGQPSLEEGESLLPSPLLSRVSSNVMVYFNGMYVNGSDAPELTSPQVPAGTLRSFALTNYAIAEAFAYNRGNLETLNDNISPAKLRKAFEENVAASQIEVPAVAQMPWQQAVAMNEPVQQGEQNVDPQPQLESQQMIRNTFELAARRVQSDKTQARLQHSKKQWYVSQKSAGRSRRPARGAGGANKARLSAFPFPPAAENVREDIMQPLWVGRFLLLARRVTVDGRTYIQGMWLNWEHIRAELLESVADLLPRADLIPAHSVTGTEGARIMASLPVKLIPGPPARPGFVVKSPLRIPLAVAWGCVLLAAAAVGILLVGVVALSERRSAFVSAVTHELRTPLTTFQMYTEMLETGMVKDKERERQYLRTLRSEGQRLGHLVENVLSYSRLERGRSGGHALKLPIAGLMEQVKERLAQRAEQAGMTLMTLIDDDAARKEIRVDTGMVEQILFNLVDNACKYACGAADRRIHINAVMLGNRVAFRVRDHGPGIAPHERKRLFKPFRKSARHAAESAPGVGLGLALSRRLARRLGGDLRICAERREGACFELLLPCAVTASRRA